MVFLNSNENFNFGKLFNRKVLFIKYLLRVEHLLSILSYHQLILPGLRKVVSGYG